MKNTVKAILNACFTLPKKALLSAIELYQKTLSFDHGPLHKFYPNLACKYCPSCSEYSYQAIQKFGVIKGILKSFWRIIRCNPLSKGGYDPLN